MSQSASFQVVLQRLDVVALAVGTDDQPGQLLAQRLVQGPSAAAVTLWPLRRVSRATVISTISSWNVVTFAGHCAGFALAEPELRDAERNGVDPVRFDIEAAAEQVAGERAVGGDFGPAAEDVAGADRQALEEGLGFADLAAVQGHDHARIRAAARQRDRNEERPVGGVQDVVGLGVDRIAGQQDLCRQVARRMQPAGKAARAERKALVVDLAARLA